jgi:N-ATPase, AtpR subunit
MTGIASSWMTGAPVVAGLAGFVFGLFYFAAVERTAVLIASKKSALAPISLTLGRVVAATAFLALATQFGDASLLSAFLGFLLARTVALRKAGRAR